RASVLRRVDNSERGKHAVVDRIVQEENLGDLDRDVREGQHAYVDQRVHKVPECSRERVEHGPDHDETEHGEDRPEDAGGEVIRQHLEAGRDLFLGEAIELLDEPGAERPDDHRAEEHGNARPDDDAGGHDRSDNAAAVPVDELPTGVSDEEREQIRDHRPDELRERLVRGPARWNEERGDESPRDKCADVRYDHCGEIAAETLHALLHGPPPPPIAKRAASSEQDAALTSANLSPGSCDNPARAAQCAGSPRMRLRCRRSRSRRSGLTTTVCTLLSSSSGTVLTTRSVAATSRSLSKAVFETTRVISTFGNSAERRETRIHAVAIPAGQTTVTRVLGRRRFRSSDPARYIVRKPTSSWGTTASPTGCRAATISLATRYTSGYRWRTSWSRGLVTGRPYRSRTRRRRRCSPRLRRSCTSSPRDG